MHIIIRGIRLFVAVVLMGICVLFGTSVRAQSGAQNATADPVLFLQYYFDTLNNGDYTTAYSLWSTPPGGVTLDTFARGYTDTARIAAFVRLPIVYEGATGTIYAQVPSLVVGVQRDGTQQVFSGCYILSRSNLSPAESGLTDLSWRLFDSNIEPRSNADLNTLSSACERNAIFGFDFPPLTSQANPTDLLSAYFDAITRQDYARAYGYWETPPLNQTLAQFSSGFSDFASVQVYLRLATRSDAGAGNVYTTLPAVLSVTLRSGGQQFFAGCYTAHRTNVPVGDNLTANPNEYLALANVRAATSLANAASRSAMVCPAL